MLREDGCFLRILQRADYQHYNYQFPNMAFINATIRKPFSTFTFYLISVSEAVPSYRSFGSQAIAHVVAKTRQRS